MAFFSFLSSTVFNCVCLKSVWLLTRACELIGVCTVKKMIAHTSATMTKKSGMPRLLLRGVKLQDHLPWVWGNVKRHNTVQILLCSHNVSSSCRQWPCHHQKIPYRNTSLHPFYPIIPTIFLSSGEADVDVSLGDKHSKSFILSTLSIHKSLH